MKIDEYISICRECAEDLRATAKRFNNTGMKKDAIEWDEAADMFEELQWYREQDLIRREDAIKAVENVFDLHFYLSDEEDVTEEIMRIQKVEYGGDYEATIL